MLDDPIALVFQVQPYRDEALRSLIARAAEENGLSRVRPLCALLGAKSTRHSPVLEVVAGDLDRASEILGVAKDILEFIVPSASGAEGRSYRTHGLDLQSHLVWQARKRVSPQSLRRATYYRFAWDLICLSFCPESWEYLLDQCPRCRKGLLWNGEVAFYLCQACGLDLRKVKAKCVPMERRSVLRIAAGLVSWNQLERTSALLRIHPSARQLNPGTILELAIALGKAKLKARGELSKQRARSSGCAAAMEIGIEMLTDLPKVIRDAGAGRTEFVLPPLLQCLRVCSADMSEAARDWIEVFIRHAFPYHGISLREISEIRRTTGLVTLRDAAAALRIPRAAARGLVDEGLLPTHSLRGDHRKIGWYQTGDLRALRQVLAGKIALDNSGAVHGLRSHAVEQLLELGLLRLHTHPAISCVYEGRFLSSDDWSQFENGFAAILKSVPADAADRISLSVLFASLGPCEKPWGRLFDLAMAGRLPGGVGAFYAQRPWTTANLNVSRTLMHDVLRGASTWRHAGGASSQWTWAAAEEYLCCYPRDISKLIDLGEIVRAPGGAKTLDADSVRKTGEQWIFSSEIAAHLNIDRCRAHSWVKDSGVAKDLMDWPGWRRRDVVPLLRSASEAFASIEAAS